MAHIQHSHEEVRALLFKIPTLGHVEREKVAEVIFHLSDQDQWFPDALRRELRGLQAQGDVSELDRHAVEKAFFPDHDWSA